MAIPVNMAQAKDAIIRAIRAHLVPFLQGSPACGKSALFRSIAEEFNLKLIDLRLSQCDPTDLLGFPSINKEAGRAGYVPMDTFPLEGDPVPEGFNGWLLFLDEFNHADRSVQKAGYKVVLDRMVGNRHIHKKCAIVAAGNLDTDNAMVEEMSTALQSRLIHLELAIDKDQWIDWATANGIDHRITAYIKYKPENLYRFNPDHDDKTYASPRTWEFLSRLIKDEKELKRDLLPLMAGTVSEGIAREFYGFCQIYKQLITVPQIVADPQGTKVPTAPDVLYALTGSIAHNVNQTNVAKVMEYVQRIPVEFQVTCLREIVRRKKDLLASPAIQGWVTRNATELF